MSKIYSKDSETFKKVTFAVDTIAVGHFICGQSNGVGQNTVATTDIMWDGQNKRYRNSVMIGNKEYLGESSASAKTNKLVKENRLDGDVQHMIVNENHAVGGRSYSSIKKGGTEPLAYAKFITELTEIVNITPIVVKCFDLVHGEADLPRPWATYRDELVEFLNDYTVDCKALTGQTYNPIMVVSQISSQKVYQPDLLVNVQSLLGSLDVCRVSDMHFSCGPQYWCDTNGGTNQYHISAKDQILSGEYRARVYRLIEKADELGTPYADVITAVYPLSATIVGDYVDLVFAVPAGVSLAYDRDYVPAIANDGFVFSCDNSTTIVSQNITGVNKVRLQMSGTIGTNPDLQYAWHNGNALANGVVSGGPRGVLASNSTEMSVYYPAYQMRDYCLAFRYATGFFAFS